MTERELRVNDAHELLSVSYHDYQVVEFGFSKDRGLVKLRAPEGEAETEFVIKNPAEYNVTGIFPDTIVGEVFLFDIDALLADNNLLQNVDHIIGGRLREQDIPGFLGKLNRDRPHKLLVICSIDGGQISTISPEITGFTSA